MATEERNQTLGDYVRQRHESRGLSYYDAAERSGLHHTFWRKLEAGEYDAPAPKNLQLIARTLRAPIEDLYGLAGYAVPERLPSFRPYLRARYNLPPEALAELERYFEMLRNYYGIPDNHKVFPPKAKPVTRTVEHPRGDARQRKPRPA